MQNRMAAEGIGRQTRVVRIQLLRALVWTERCVGEREQDRCLSQIPDEGTPEMCEAEEYSAPMKAKREAKKPYPVRSEGKC